LKTFITILLSLLASISFAQNNVSMQVSETLSCEKLAAQKMTFISDGSLQSDQVVALEMEKLKACGLDDYDVKFFGRIDALSSLLKKMTKDKRLEFLIYADLIDSIDRMMETENYQQIKSITLVSQQLADRTASLQNWQQDIKLFDQLGASEVIKDKVYRYLRSNPETKLTYQELLTKLKK
jgi:hypothetical protein